MLGHYYNYLWILWPSQDKGLTFVHLSLDHADGCGQYPANRYESYRENWTPFLPDAMRIRLPFRGRGGKFRRCLFMNLHETYQQWNFMKLPWNFNEYNIELRPEKSHLVKPVFCSWLSSICERSFIDEGNFLRNILIVLRYAETDINRHNNMRTQMKAKFFMKPEIVCYPYSGVHATTIIFNV